MTLEELQKKVQVLEDIEAIKTMHREYLFQLINQQWQDMPDFFMENATLTIADLEPTTGREKIAKLLVEIVGPNVRWDSGHFIAQPVIYVDGDSASGHWLMYHFFAEPMGKWQQARYDAEYLKKDGRWRFSKLTFTVPWPKPPENA
jgi:hypothetical protein